MKNTPLTVIEITDAHVKLLQVRVRRGQRIVTACDIRALSQHTDDELSHILTNIVLSKSVDSEQFTLIIPRRMCILKQLRLPSQNQEEIKRMISLQLANHIPYSADEVVFDFVKIDKDANGYTRVLLSVVQCETVNKILRMFTNIGIAPSDVIFSSIGLAEWLEEYETKKKQDHKGTTAIVSVDSNHSEVVFCNRTLLFSRSIDMGVSHLVEPHLIRLLTQINLTFGTYKKENMGGDVQRILVVSTSSDVGNLISRLESEYKIPVETCTGLEHVLCQKNVNLTGFKEFAGISLAVALGRLNTTRKIVLNLTPLEVSTSKQTNRLRRQWIKTMVLFFVVLGLVASIVGIEVYKRVSRLNELSAQLEKTKGKAKSSRQSIEFVKILNDEFHNRVAVTDIIYELLQLTPEDVSYRSIGLDTGGTFTIQGYTKNGTGVHDLQQNLLKSPVFKNANLEFATKRKIFNWDITDFKITCQLSQDKDDAK